MGRKARRGKQGEARGGRQGEARGGRQAEGKARRGKERKARRAPQRARRNKRAKRKGKETRPLTPWSFNKDSSARSDERPAKQFYSSCGFGHRSQLWPPLTPSNCCMIRQHQFKLQQFNLSTP